MMLITYLEFAVIDGLDKKEGFEEVNVKTDKQTDSAA